MNIERRTSNIEYRMKNKDSTQESGTKKKRNHRNLISGHCNGFTIGIADPER